eukprot:PLAT2929.1.p1 GENE.PLAT2929.1~~PLAT2929.1.p1  ORF type:complete len:817 (+),score=486.07 PLAT2929.1:46-2496(+)
MASLSRDRSGSTPAQGRCSRRILMLLNVVTLALGAVLIALACGLHAQGLQLTLAASLATPVIAAGSFVIVMSLLGLCAAATRSHALLAVYFTTLLLLVLFLLLSGGLVLVYTPQLLAYVRARWAFFAPHFSGASMAAVLSRLRAHLHVIAAMALTGAGVLLLALFGTVRLLGLKSALKALLNMMNAVTLALGGVLLYSARHSASPLALATGSSVTPVMLLFFTGCIVLLTAFIGCCGTMGESKWLLRLYAALLLVADVCALVLSAIFISGQGSVPSYVSGNWTHIRALLPAGLRQLSQADFVAWAQARMAAVGFVSIVAAVYLTGLLIATATLLRRLRRTGKSAALLSGAAASSDDVIVQGVAIEGSPYRAADSPDMPVASAVVISHGDAYSDAGSAVSSPADARGGRAASGRSASMTAQATSRLKALQSRHRRGCRLCAVCVGLAAFVVIVVGALALSASMYCRLANSESDKTTHSFAALSSLHVDSTFARGLFTLRAAPAGSNYTVSITHSAVRPARLAKAKLSLLAAGSVAISDIAPKLQLGAFGVDTSCATSSIVLSVPVDGAVPQLTLATDGNVAIEGDNLVLTQPLAVTRAGDVSINGLLNHAPLTVDIHSGDVNVNNVTVFAPAKLHTQSGDISAASLTLLNGTLSLVSDSGDVALASAAIDDAEPTQRITLTTVSGDVDVIGGRLAAGSLTATSTSGDVQLTSLHASTLTATSTNGDVTATTLTLKKKATMTSTSGDIDISFAARGFAGRYSLTSSSGDADISGPGIHPQLNKGNKRTGSVKTAGASQASLTASTTSGDVSVRLDGAK